MNFEGGIPTLLLILFGTILPVSILILGIMLLVALYYSIKGLKAYIKINKGEDI